MNLRALSIVAALAISTSSAGYAQPPLSDADLAAEIRQIARSTLDLG